MLKIADYLVAATTFVSALCRLIDGGSQRQNAGGTKVPLGDLSPYEPFLRHHRATDGTNIGQRKLMRTRTLLSGY